MFVTAFHELLTPSGDKFVRRCRAITERITEEISSIEGEWLTESDMKNLNYSE